MTTMTMGECVQPTLDSEKVESSNDSDTYDPYDDDESVHVNSKADSDEDDEGEKEYCKQRKRWDRMYRLASLALHVSSIMVYVQPISSSSPAPFSSKEVNLIASPSAQLDELHIMSSEHGDIIGTTSLKEVFTNDYWGRSMNYDSSHKSYRPISILSFRYGKYLNRALLYFQILDRHEHLSYQHGQASQQQGYGHNAPGELFMHRFLNVILHSATAEVASRVALHILPLSSSYSQISYVKCYLFALLVKLLFFLHPTHIECVVNAANRSHILALFLTLLQLDYYQVSPTNTTRTLDILSLSLLHILGLGSSETAVFTLPAIVASWIFLHHRNHRSHTSPQTLLATFLSTLLRLLPRILLLSTLTSAYLLLRTALDWMSIPEGLIRPAENPFYTFRGWRRVINYAHVSTIHLAKGIGPVGLLDWVGFSHEYGFDCIPELGAVPNLFRANRDEDEDGKDWDGDGRYLLLLLLVVLLYRVGGYCANKGTGGMLAGLAAGSWIATLFPVSGFVRVGTFVSDRIVISCSFLGTLIWAWIWTCWLLQDWELQDEVSEEDEACEGDKQVENEETKQETNMEKEDEAQDDEEAKEEQVENEVTKEEIKKEKEDEAKEKTKENVATNKPWNRTIFKATLLLLHTTYLWAKIQSRSAEWMDSEALLRSSLRSCPRSAKSNLEMSKIHSGAFQDRTDLPLALQYLETAEDIDPNYCDVHQQFAHVYIQLGRMEEFEERLVKGVLCPFTMVGSFTLYSRYWEAILAGGATVVTQNGQLAIGRLDDKATNKDVVDARIRYNKYQRIIQEAVQNEREKELMKGGHVESDGAGDMDEL